MKLRRFRPDSMVCSVTEISLRRLKGEGVRALLLDVDNTLAAWNEPDISPAVEAWLHRARRGGFALVFISNNHAPRLVPLAERVNALVLADARKPKPEAFRLAARMANTPVENCLMIGDQLMTDIKGAKRAGMRAWLVNPISKKEFWGTKINRVFERLLLAAQGLKRPRLP